MKDSLFSGYVSNTHASFCAQNAFFPERPDEVQTGRVFYRLFAGGTYRYRLFFGNIIDSTFAEGEFCHPNELCNSWHIHACKVGICPNNTDIAVAQLKNMQTLTFDGKSEKAVMLGEIFACDEIEISARENDYLCLETSFSGSKIPYLAEAHATVPTFCLHNGQWCADVKVPGAFLIGCDRRVKKHIAFLGDSITMGCGTKQDDYRYWAARIGDIIGKDYAWWNLGIGYARCKDAATDGSWLYKAKQADLVNICLGTNDLIRNATPDEVIRALHTVTDKLKASDCDVGIFTLPPFDYEGEALFRWEEVNKRIQTEFAKKAVYIFDTCPYLAGIGENRGKGKYNPHPNEEGCEILATAFARFAQENNILRLSPKKR